MNNKQKTLTVIFLLFFIGNILLYDYNHILAQQPFFTEFIKNFQNKITDFRSKTPPDTKKTEKYLVIEPHIPQYSPSDSPITIEERTLPSNAKLISTEKVTNVGYTFYVGSLDYASSSTISDNFKNQLTNILAASHYPQKLLNSFSIINVNTLAATDLMYAQTPKGWVKIDNFDSNFLNDTGRYYNYFNAAGIIFINKANIEYEFNLKDVLSHELGHVLSITLNTDDWKEYYKLRDIPIQNKIASFYPGSFIIEDFADVFTNVYTGLPIDNKFAIPNQKTKNYIISIIKKLNSQ